VPALVAAPGGLIRIRRGGRISERKGDAHAGGQQPENDRPPKKVEVRSVSPDPIMEFAYRADDECILSRFESLAARLWRFSVE
jgi:peptide subunit release factor 1 (eRF1)